MSSRHSLGDEKHHELDDIAYTVAVGNLTATPTLVNAFAYDISTSKDTYTDVTNTVLSGSGSVDGTTVTTPLVVGSAMTIGNFYRILLEISDGGSQRFALYFDLKCIGETEAAA